MDRSEVLTLISITHAADSIGQQVPAEESREVFCNVSSVGREEWHEAGQMGLAAAYKVTMFEPDYAGEEIAALYGKRYSIYRTYRSRGEELELYLGRKAGV